jgi:hypothetical protein
MRRQTRQVLRSQRPSESARSALRSETPNPPTRDNGGSEVKSPVRREGEEVESIRLGEDRKRVSTEKGRRKGETETHRKSLSQLRTQPQTARKRDHRRRVDASSTAKKRLFVAVCPEIDEAG